MTRGALSGLPSTRMGTPSRMGSPLGGSRLQHPHCACRESPPPQCHTLDRDEGTPCYTIIFHVHFTLTVVLVSGVQHRGCSHTVVREHPTGPAPLAAPGFPVPLAHSWCCGSCYTGVDRPSHSGHVACHTHEAWHEGVADSNPVRCFQFYFTDRLPFNTAPLGESGGRETSLYFYSCTLSLRMFIVCDFTRLKH